MIRGIKLVGFQSHVDTSINLTEGLNVITGPSDSGKTAVIRAVRWVALNEPQGDAVVNQSVGYAQVTIITDTGVVTKVRNKGKVRYEINIDGENISYDKSEIPQEVYRILGINKTSFGDVEVVLPFAFQLDAPFLISSPASFGGKVLGKICNADTVELAVKKSSREVSQANDAKRQAEKTIEETKLALQSYENLQEVEQRLQQCRELVTDIEKGIVNRDTLSKLHNSYIAAYEKLNAVRDTVHLLSEIPQRAEEVSALELQAVRYNRLLTLYSKYSATNKHLNSVQNIINKTRTFEQATLCLEFIEEVRKRLQRLQSLREAYKNNETKLKALRDKINVSRGVEAGLELLDALHATQERLNRITALRNAYANILNAIKANADEITKHKQAVDTLQAEWDKIDVCPLCERPMKGDE